MGRDRPRQAALDGSTTQYQLQNVAHDTEYVLTLYVLFGAVVGPGVSATFRTCEHYVLTFYHQSSNRLFFTKRLMTSKESFRAI